MIKLFNLIPIPNEPNKYSLDLKIQSVANLEITDDQFKSVNRSLRVMFDNLFDLANEHDASRLDDDERDDGESDE